MYSDSVKRHSRFLWVVLALLVLLTALVLLLERFETRDLSQESTAAIREAVRRCALQCYAVEGVYPPDLQYMEDYYGLQVNTREYYITYDAFASNLPPTIYVTAR